LALVGLAEGLSAARLFAARGGYRVESDQELFWVTAAPIHDAIFAKVDSAPGTRALVLDMEETNQMDTTSVDALADLLGSLRKRDIDLYLVHVMWPVRKVLRRSGLMAELGEDHLWHSIPQGVREAAPTGSSTFRRPAASPPSRTFQARSSSDRTRRRSTSLPAIQVPTARTGTGQSPRDAIFLLSSLIHAGRAAPRP
jgi:anti-anti-sigma factor